MGDGNPRAWLDWVLSIQEPVLPEGPASPQMDMCVEQSLGTRCRKQYWDSQRQCCSLSGSTAAIPWAAVTVIPIKCVHRHFPIEVFS